MRGHHRLTGKDRGAAHERCNLMLWKTDKVSFFFDIIRGYDSHLIVWALGSFAHQDISLIGQGMER